MFGKLIEAILGEHDEAGQTVAEYGPVLALVAIVALGVVAALGGQLEKLFVAFRDVLPWV